MINGLDLFSGIGGGALALAPWVRPIAYCESFEPAQNNLLTLQQKGAIPIAPICDDIRTLRRGHVGVPVDFIYGGWPCQDLSAAGTRKGLEGERSGLVFEILRLIREFEPGWVFLENSPRVTVSGLGRILLELNALGYDARWTIISAEEMGAPHVRERFWILAHAHGEPLRIQSERFSWKCDPALAPNACANEISDAPCFRRASWGSHCERSRCAETTGACRSHCDTLRTGRQRWLDAKAAWKEIALGSGSGSGSWPLWLPEPVIGRGHYGVPDRVDRLHGLGNAWVPQVAREAFMRLSGIA